GMTSYYDVQLKRDRVALLRQMRGFQMVEGMLEDMPALYRAAEAASPDVIIHLAAQAGVRYSIEQPQTYVDSNLIGSWHVLELALFKFVDAIERGDPIDVYGQGVMARDFTYVDDLVEAITKLVPLAPRREAAGAAEGDAVSPSAPFRVINIGGGQPVALMEFI